MNTTLQRLRIADGVYRGSLSYTGTAPKISLHVNGQHHAACDVKTTKKGTADLSVALPDLPMSEDRIVLALVDEASDELLDVFSAGLDAEESLRSEVEALRQELDLLKSAFRRALQSKS